MDRGTPIKHLQKKVTLALNAGRVFIKQVAFAADGSLLGCVPE